MSAKSAWVQPSSMSRAMGSVRCPRCGHTGALRDLTTTKSQMAAELEAAKHTCRGNR